MFQLAFKNFQKSIRDYTIYFMTLLLAIVIFYTFNTLAAQKEIFTFAVSIKQALELVSILIDGISVIVVLVLTFLIVYANAYFIKRRKKELGIYTLLGMKQREISGIIVIETMFVGIASLVIGLFFGVLVSQFLSTMIAALFDVKLARFQFIFSLPTMLKTIGFFCFVYLLVLIMNIIQIRRYPLIKLIESEKENEKHKVKNEYVSLLLFIVAVVGLSYSCFRVLSVSMIELTEGRELFYHIINGVVMTFLFYYSLTGFLLSVSQKFKQRYYHKLNFFTIRQINHRVNSHFMSLAIVSLMIFVAVGIFSSGYAMQESFSKQTGYLTSDVMFFTSWPGKYTLSERLLDSTYVKDVQKTLVYRTEIRAKQLIQSQDEYNYDVQALSLKEVNQNRQKEGKAPLQLENNEYILLHTFSDEKAMVANTTDIRYEEQTLKQKAVHQVGAKQLFGPPNQVIIVLPDSIVNQEKSVLYITANLVDFKNQAETYQKILDDTPTEFGKITRFNELLRQKLTRFTIVFISLYIGLIFLIVSVTLLAIQQLVHIQNSKSRYDLLLKLGVLPREMNRSIFEQICFHFMLPLCFGFIFASVGTAAVNTSINQLSTVKVDLFQNILIASSGIFTLYVVYMMMTYMSSTRLMRK